MVILDLADKDDIKILPLSLEGLKNILFKKLKINKACDIYKLTVEHLRYSGDQTFELLVQIINLILCHLNYISSNQLNTSIASIVHKGKDKPVFVHKSYRQVRVTPLIARIIEEHLRPNLIKITKPIQNSSQSGFTESVTYLMAALQRHETEKFCIDEKRTFFWL